MSLAVKKTVSIAALIVLSACGGKSSSESPSSAATPASTAASGDIMPSLSVQVVQPRQDDWSTTLAAFGPIAPWQESVIGAEVNGLRLTQVLVNVGDVVRKGQPLATLRSDSLQADVSAARAALQEGQAALMDAHANAERGQQLRKSEFISPQEAQRLITLEKTTQARVNSLKAQLSTIEVRLAQSRVLSPEDGVISARQAVAGMTAQPGQELFRLIVKSRLEWRAQAPAADLSKIKAGVVASLTAPGTSPVQGKVRMVSPTVDASTRQGMVYVDLPIAEAANAGMRSGMFASGSFELSRARALTVPQTAVLLRDGFSLVFEVQQDKVRQRKVTLGRRLGDRVEIVQGIDANAQLVASGVGFLADGDTVRVVTAASPAATTH